MKPRIIQEESCDSVPPYIDTSLYLAEYLSEIVARFDCNLRHLYVNPAVEKITGIPRIAFQGKTNLELGMPQTLVKLWDGKLTEAFAGGLSGEFEFEYAGTDGKSSKHMKTQVIPELDQHGQVVSVITFTRDITDHKFDIAEKESLKRKQSVLDEKHNQDMRNVLVHTIEALSAALEKRDPYTAGHQSRTAVLARKTGQKLGLPDEQLQGIWFGALIHDIGKISIPAEILNRPGKLDVHEFGLIKRHAKTGFEIVQDIEFSWPVAQMILQHHERLDGSGYPHGLKGDEILIESRIIAVSDVVDAISTHRPYRSSLGLLAGLQEIQSKAATHFDVNAVAALTAVIAEEPELIR